MLPDFQGNDALRLRRARTFDEVAELYDRGRREYRDQLVTDLFALAEMDPSNTDVLEIGCGTGQATLPLARHGCRIVALEMGANLARIARRKLALFPVKIINESFESWDAGNERFDVVFAANSWHWIDPAVRYRKSAAVLRSNGILAFVTSRQAHPPGFDPFFAEIQNTYAAIGMPRLIFVPPEQVPDASEEIERSGFFDSTRVIRRVHAEEFTAEEYVNLMNTASDHRLLEPSKRELLFAEMRRMIGARPNGRVLRHHLTMLHIARKKP